MSYCLGVAAESTGVQLHAVCVMSNHWHAVVSDPEARLPEFLERAHRLIAKALNAVFERWENFWSSDKPSVVVLATEQAVLDKMAYVIANPTRAGLVRSPDQWPGVITLRLGKRISVEMPDVFFDASGDLPDETVLEFTRPAIFGGLSDVELGIRLDDAVADLVREARRRLASENRSFIGGDSVRRQSHHARPSSPRPHRTLNPRVAAHEASLRLRAIKALQDFAKAYRRAWLAWREGKRRSRFPMGTYALRLQAPVRCEPLIPT